MAPAIGRTVWPKPGRCLTIDNGEMLDSISRAEWPSCLSSQASNAGSCELGVTRGRREMRAAEAQRVQPVLHFGHAHEQLPQQTRTMVLHHHDDRALVDGEKGVGEPAAPFAERIDE